MKIVPISLPTPFYIGPVNVYLIPEDPITLIDTGPKTKEAVAALRAALRQEGLSVADIRRIVLTHAHEDHCGLARALRDEAKDAEVLVHGWETGHRAGRLEYDETRQLLARAGVPPDEVEVMRRMYEGVRQYADSLDDGDCIELTDEAEIEFESGALQVVYTPGHTPGSCSFIRHADRTLIAEHGVALTDGKALHVGQAERGDARIGRGVVGRVPVPEIPESHHGSLPSSAAATL